MYVIIHAETRFFLWLWQEAFSGEAPLEVFLNAFIEKSLRFQLELSIDFQIMLIQRLIATEVEEKKLSCCELG